MKPRAHARKGVLMPTITKTTCSRCKNEYEGTPALHIYMPVRHVPFTVPPGQNDDWDLCQPCLIALFAWILTGVGV